MEELNVIGRNESLFKKDILDNRSYFKNEISSSSFLVIGGAGTIGQAVVKEIFKFDPKKLHVVDISENNLVELVRDIRSTMVYGSGEFEIFAIDCGGSGFEKMFTNLGGYDYIFNLSALKHVRSEKDPYTLLRMIEVNILNTLKTVNFAKNSKTKKYFSVSTDKAANPANIMGASKKIMEMFLMRESKELPISMARFANVAFSDGSLLHGFRQRLIKNQPISAPKDIKRYFISPEESGQLCLFSALQGKNIDIYFPKLDEKIHLQKFSDIADRFLQLNGYEVIECNSEDEARAKVGDFKKDKKWPCYFFESDTTGEKPFEEFYTNSEILDLEKYYEIGIIKNETLPSEKDLNEFLSEIDKVFSSKNPTKDEILNIVFSILPSFKETYISSGKNLNQRM